MQLLSWGSVSIPGDRTQNLALSVSPASCSSHPVFQGLPAMLLGPRHGTVMEASGRPGSIRIGCLLVLLEEERTNGKVCAWEWGANGRHRRVEGKGVQEGLPQLSQGK